MLLKSVTSLAMDVRKLNSKVDTLAHKEQREEKHKREELHEERRERDDERREKKREIGMYFTPMCARVCVCACIYVYRGEAQEGGAA